MSDERPVPPPWSREWPWLVVAALALAFAGFALRRAWVTTLASRPQPAATRAPKSGAAPGGPASRPDAGKRAMREIR